MNFGLFVTLFSLIAVALAVRERARYVPTPGGMVWSECIHTMEHGSRVFEQDDKLVVVSPAGVKTVYTCPKPTIPTPRRERASSGPADGWQVWTTFQHPSNQTFKTFVGNFTVPNAPKSFGSGILYMFFGLQSDNWVPIANEPPAPPTFDIIQPVLQYGYGPAGGGLFWGLASWYVTLNAGAVNSALIRVNPGDSIYGNMTMTGPTTWFINGVTPSGKNTSVTVSHPRLSTQPWAYTTLELYSIDSCNYLPPTGSSIKFSNMALTDEQGSITPTWRVNSNGNGNHCSTSVTVTDPTDSSINF